MSELLQEFVDCRSQQLRVDRAAGVIRGVKLLGLRSRNGRRYQENALAEAIEPLRGGEGQRQSSEGASAFAARLSGPPRHRSAMSSSGRAMGCSATCISIPSTRSPSS